MQYRHELKFRITQADVARLDTRLSGILQTDSHIENGAYTVRSLYFDDLYDTCLEEVLSGVDNTLKMLLL